MSAALQMPLEVGEATRLGGRLFRKQVLRQGEIEYDGERLRFDRPYLEQLVENFNAGAFDQVPLVLATDENRHNEDPSRFRGEVKALELTGDGLDVIVELTDDGAELVRKNPRLGVSARLVPEFKRADGRHFRNVLRHVCATLDPKLNGMRPWESVSLSVRWGPQDGDQVIDLTTSQYVADQTTPTLTDDQLDELKGLSGDARAAKARELLGEMTPSSSTADKDKGGKKFSLKSLLGIKDDSLSEDDLEAALAKLDGEDDEDEEAGKPGDREPVAASLSSEDRKAIDLARQEAAEARREAADERWKRERKDYADAGVPPAMLDPCEPLFKNGGAQVIDLSNGEKFDAGEVIHKLLDEAKGYVDLAVERGSAEDSDPAVKDAKDKAVDDKAWGLA